MPAGSWIDIASPAPLIAGCVLSVILLAVLLIRRPVLPRVSKLAILLAAVLLTLAAGEPRWITQRAPRLAVVVDVSASTRAASFRDIDWLKSRVAQFAGAARIEWYTLGDGVKRSDFTQLAESRETPLTRFDVPPADAILLFSDARFDLPAVAPPIFIYRDPLLDAPADASVVDLLLNAKTLLATVDSRDAPRTLSWSGTSESIDTVVQPAGRFVLSRSLDPASELAGIAFEPRDRWPENDRLRIAIPPQPMLARWWVGGDAPDASWNLIDVENIPENAAAYLRPSIIVLKDVAPAALSPVQQQRIEQYVRDLGGALLILAGPRTFAVGEFEASVLARLSPLLPTPPSPQVQWILMTDASGSMAAQAGAQTLFEIAAAGMIALLQALPPDDVVIIGSFAKDVRWWSGAASIRAARALSLPPDDLRPNGPTNLQSLLDAVARSANPTLPNELILLSDGQAALVDPDALARTLQNARVRIHLIHIAEEPLSTTIAGLVAATGGTVVQQADPKGWAEAARQTLATAARSRVAEAPADAIFTGVLANLPARQINTWMHAWPRENAMVLAKDSRNSGAQALVASQRIGSGQVVAAAFDPTEEELSEMLAAITRPPSDPRLAIDVHVGARLEVQVDARYGLMPLNDLVLTVAILPVENAAPTPELHPIPQVAPGRYLGSLQHPGLAGLLVVRMGEQVISTTPFADRYAREFENIGNDVRAMKTLATRTGGEVLGPQSKGSLKTKGPSDVRSLDTGLLLASIGALGVALIVWRK